MSIASSSFLDQVRNICAGRVWRSHCQRNVAFYVHASLIKTIYFPSLPANETIQMEAYDF